MFPSIVKNYNLFVQGRGKAGLCDEAEVPEYVERTEEHSAGGMDGTAEVGMGQEAMRAKFTMAEVDPDLLRLVGIANGNTARLVLRASAQREDESFTTAHVYEMHGAIRNLKIAPFKKGEKTTVEFEMSVNYYRVNLAGEDLLEIDVINMIRRVGGVDQLALQRADLGM